VKRREFIKGSILAAALPGLPPNNETKREFHLFAKCFQQMSAPELAEFAAKAGFAGIEWPVRPNGFIKPERVREELPAAIEAGRKQGLKCEMIVTNINSPETQYAETILKTARDCGVKVYRMGYYAYDKDLPVSGSIDKIRRQFAAMEGLSRTCGMTAGYQNHSSFGRVHFGGLVWDIHEVIRELDPQYVSSQYDVMHALVETSSSWCKGMDLIHGHIRSACLKDFYWVPSDKNPKDRMFQVCPAGEGIVAWREYADLFRKLNIRGPVSIHCDYPMEKNRLLELVKKEIDYFKGVLG